MLQTLGWQFALVAVIGAALGLQVMAAFLVAALIGALLLEAVIYIEHYGLRRACWCAQPLLPRGACALVEQLDRVLGRLTLFELTRHSDHHGGRRAEGPEPAQHRCSRRSCPRGLSGHHDAEPAAAALLRW